MNKKGFSGGNWFPLFAVLIILFVFGAIMNIALKPFIDITQPNQDSSLNNNLIFNFVVNTTSNSNSSLVGTGFGGFIHTQFVLLTYVPDIIVIPFMIIFFMALIWTSVKLILP